jgi:hypothetical protein
VQRPQQLAPALEVGCVCGGHGTTLRGWGSSSNPSKPVDLLLAAFAGTAVQGGLVAPG